MTQVWKQRVGALMFGGAVMFGMASNAAAQITLPPRPATTTSPDDEEQQPYSRWHMGVSSNVTEVARTNLLLGGEFGVRLKRGLHLVVEGGRFRDVVTQSRIDESNTYVQFVRSAYGVTAEGNMRGNAWFGMTGLRLIPDGKPRDQSAGMRPYVVAMAGLARVEYNPRYLVDGQDISGGALALYGVTLGKDLLGTTTRFAYSGGAGIVFGETWYLDLGVRITRINTTDHPTNVKRAVIGLGRRF